MNLNHSAITKALAWILALLTLLSCLGVGASAAKVQAKKTPEAAYTAVAKAYGKSMPLSKKDRIKGKKRVMGIKTADLESYYAASKVKGGKNDQREYTVFICKVKTAKKAKSVNTALKSHLKSEQQSMNNYLSPTGKKLFKNAKVGTIGKFVYLVMLDTSANKKAVNAIKKTLK